jgi:hypothetical protein
MSFSPRGFLSATLGSLFLLAIAGCGQAEPKKVGSPGGPLPPPPDTSNLPTASSVRFANWSKFEPGAGQKRLRTVTKPEGWVKETHTQILKEKTPEKVVVETQITVEWSSGQKDVNPAIRMDFPATFKVPEGLSAEAMEAPSLRAKRGVEEEITVLGKKYKAFTYEWSDSTDGGGPVKNKVWFSDEIPGRQLKLTANWSGTAKAEEELLEILPANQK